MSELFESKLTRAESLIKNGLDAAAAAEILEIIGAPALPAAALENSMLYKETLPRAAVAGSPARIIRERKTGGHAGDELDHIWLY